MTRPTEQVIADMQRQISEARPYIAIAIAAGHAFSLVQQIQPDGRVSPPKVSIDTKGTRKN